MSKTSVYKGVTIEHSTPSLGFFSSGRGGKVVRKFWVGYPTNPGMGRWFDSLAAAKKWIKDGMFFYFFIVVAGSVVSHFVIKKLEEKL